MELKQSRIGRVSTLVSYSVTVTSGQCCIVQTLPRTMPVALVTVSDSQNDNLLLYTDHCHLFRSAALSCGVEMMHQILKRFKSPIHLSEEAG